MVYVLLIVNEINFDTWWLNDNYSNSYNYENNEYYSIINQLLLHKIYIFWLKKISNVVFLFGKRKRF